MNCKLSVNNTIHVVSNLPSEVLSVFEEGLKTCVSKCIDRYIDYFVRNYEKAQEKKKKMVK